MLTSQWPDRCATTSCVHARISGAYTEIRNSNDPDGPRIWLPVAEWHYLLDAIRAGRTPPGVEGDEHSGDVTMVRVVELQFSHEEWAAFVVKVRAGDYDTETAPPSHPQTAPEAADVVA